MHQTWDGYEFSEDGNTLPLVCWEFHHIVFLIICLLSWIELKRHRCRHLPKYSWKKGTFNKICTVFLTQNGLTRDDKKKNTHAHKNIKSTASFCINDLFTFDLKPRVKVYEFIYTFKRVRVRAFILYSCCLHAHKKAPYWLTKRFGFFYVWSWFPPSSQVHLIFTGDEYFFRVGDYLLLIGL